MNLASSLLRWAWRSLQVALPNSTRSNNNYKVSFDEATAGLESSTHVDLGALCLVTPSSKGIPESDVAWREVRNVRTGKVLHSEPFSADQPSSELSGPTDLKTTFWFRSGSVSDSVEQDLPQRVFQAETRKSMLGGVRQLSALFLLEAMVLGTMVTPGAVLG